MSLNICLLILITETLHLVTISRNQVHAGLWPACTWFKIPELKQFYMLFTLKLSNLLNIVMNIHRLVNDCTFYIPCFINYKSLIKLIYSYILKILYFLYYFLPAILDNKMHYFLHYAPYKIKHLKHSKRLYQQFQMHFC